MFGLKGVSNKDFEKWIIDNQQKLYRLAFVYVKNEHDALDVVQEGIIKAYKNLSKLKEAKAIEKWVNRIVINTAIDYIKKENKVSVIGDEIIEVIVDKNPVVNDGFTIEVGDLEPQLKSIIILKYFHGYTIDEIGEILDISISTVKNRLHKALNMLRKSVKEESYE